MNKSVQHLRRILKFFIERDSCFDLVATACCLTSISMSSGATSIAIDGTHTFSDFEVSDSWSTGSGSNPYVRLKFDASGAVVQSYQLDYNLDAGAPVKTIAPGSSFGLNPLLSNVSANLSATQNITYGSSFRFDWTDNGLLVPDIHIDTNLPDFNLVGSLNAHGTGNLPTISGCGPIPFPICIPNDYQNLGYGLGKISTRDDPMAKMDAWHAAVDLTSVIPLPTPGINLDLGMDIDIGRVDTVYLSSYDLPDLASILVPADFVGDEFAFDIETRFTYDLTFLSTMYYVGELGLELRGKLVPDTELFSPDLDDWVVGRAAETLEFEQMVRLTGTVHVGQPNLPGEYCPADCLIGDRFLMIDLTPSPQSPPTANHPVYDIRAVPEPNAFALVAIGFLGIIWMRRQNFGSTLLS
jgi:hypothetical protein